ncbi:S9 family peptidase [Prevotella lacticifex]|uniref:Prolyl tripeptidyl peptidase n=1 Tax=Prevotella lacticifex TaxID=2854755 RepID=A0A9R1C9N9_9BACT|nr:S9 family peptidase [Prevotella lacticifex]GJG35345.1 prolyl tripeptidyl peptidase [Prevotella lacticifex]GJG39604.1 prolyl tripeptidyl peptidase [Prevotella lacticifex]GJG41714.1 prolyl tripeptidyl peptidase [Prevotella lacticifex]GJG45960.1 prolyl tripeptidyl peptidase [Prevotella lacticifex]GJG48065.1 prolyl tripeptidyl peptidase [Prevotella lacticifex]
MKGKLKCIGLMLAIGLLSSMSAMAQNKQFTLEDLNFGGVNYRKFYPENRYTTWWGDRLIRLNLDYCAEVDKTSGKEKRIVSLDEINKVAGLSGSELVRSLYYAAFPYADKPVISVENSGERFLYNFKTKKVEWRSGVLSTDPGHNVYGDEKQSSEWNSASRATAFVAGNQLYVADAKGNIAKLTTDGSRDIVYGQSVHRDEFGINGGLFWSPKGNKLAFYRMDQSMVTDYPLVNIPEIDWTPKEGQSRIDTPEPIKYPMAGETSHKVTVGVYDLRTKKTVYLQAGDPTDRYFTNIAWSPDETTIYMFELNRDQNDCRLVSYDAASGEKKGELYRETDEKYVEPLHPIVFLPWDNSKFIMQSQKDGYNHLYLFNKDGKEIKQITNGKWVVMDFLGFDAKSHDIIYSSNEANPIQQNIWTVNVDNGKRKLVDESGKGWHNGTISASGRYILDNYQEPTVPRKISIINSETAKCFNYFTAPDPWKGYNLPEYSTGTIKAADGVTDLYYRLVKPVNFDPKKKYPTVVYVYGGPHAHNVDARWHWASRSWETYMAQKGYVLFILDNRGSENRGKAFEQVTFRHLGQEEMKDQMKGVDFLRTLSYVDTTRIGVHGWSFGGFMTISLMTNHPDVFKVGVAGGPVIDWKWYEVMYGERYMDTPQTNPEGYRQTSLLNKAKDLKGKLQIIIGLNDPVVVPQHEFSFLKACIAAGTQPDFFVYPGEPHNMRGHQSVHLHERITQYFEDYLK